MVALLWQHLVYLGDKHMKQKIRKWLNFVGATAAFISASLALWVVWRCGTTLEKPITPTELTDFIYKQTWITTSLYYGLGAAVISGLCRFLSALLDFE